MWAVAHGFADTCTHCCRCTPGSCVYEYVYVCVCVCVCVCVRAGGLMGGGVGG